MKILTLISDGCRLTSSAPLIMIAYSFFLFAVLKTTMSNYLDHVCGITL